MHLAQPRPPEAKPTRAAVFLDRDGVINVNRDDYVKSWAEFEFLPASFSALRRLAFLDIPVIVVTNQSIIGRGMALRATVEVIHSNMIQAVKLAGGRIDAVLYCPHRPEDECVCRKPRPGLLLQAAAEMSIDLSRSFLVGDADSDMQVARAAGCRPIFVKSGRGNSLLNRMDDLRYAGMHVAEDLAEAVNWIEGQINCI